MKASFGYPVSPIAILLLLLALLGSCVPTETTNPPDAKGCREATGICGQLVDVLGKPVAGAKVSAIPIGKSPLAKGMGQEPAAAPDSTVTNQDGFYILDSMLPAHYNLLGDFRGGMAVFIPDIQYRPGNLLTVATDTLRVPGRIAAQVLLAPDKGMPGAFCYIPGTSFLSISDDNGKCWLSNVPQGIYDLKYGYPGYLTLTDSGVRVLSSEITLLAPKLMRVDTALPPPPPDSLQAVYDTLAGVCRLSWSPVRVSDLDGYAVYRSTRAGETPVRINANLWRDTSFADTVFRFPFDTVAKELTYRIKSQDRDANLSLTFSPPTTLRVISPEAVRTRIRFRIETPFGDTVVMRDTIRVIADYANRIHRLTRVTWYQGTGDALAEKTLADSAGSDTLAHAWSDPGPVRLAAVFRDAWGREWRDSIHFSVLRDAPIARAGMDALIQPGVPAQFKGSGEDRYGRIVQYAWDFDADGEFDETSETSGDAWKVFDSRGPQTVVFRVQDDDGNYGYDTLRFIVGGSESEFLGGTVSHDLTFKKVGFPYRISADVRVLPGVTVTINPGVELAFKPGVALVVEGQLICAGRPDDSIRITADTSGSGTGGSVRAEGGIHFRGGVPSRTEDTAHLSGSRISYTGFRNCQGVSMEGTHVTVENNSFENVASTRFNGQFTGGAVDLLEGSPAGGTWIFRRNRISRTGEDGLAVYVGRAGPDAFHPDLRLLIRENAFSESGITLMLPKEKVDIAVERNSILRASNALTLIGGRAGVLRDNLVHALDQALVLHGEVSHEIAHNDLQAGRYAFYDDGYHGRFHHNRVLAGHFASNNFKTQGVLDSNDLAVTVKVYGQADYRRNYWGTTNLESIRNRTQSGIPDQVLFEPILPYPPTDAGRRRK